MEPTKRLPAIIKVPAHPTNQIPTVADPSVSLAQRPLQARRAFWVIRREWRPPSVSVQAVRLTVPARRRQTRHVLIATSLILVASLTSVGAATHSAQLSQTFQAITGMAIIPPGATAPPAPPDTDHPRVAGAHAFLCAALPWARYASAQMTLTNQAEPYPWFVSVILGQWAVEQGLQMPTYTGYNFGNVSAIAGYPSIGGTHVAGSPARFAYATTTQQGVDEYLIFARNNHHFYEAISRAYPAGPVAQAVAVGVSPWDAAHYTAIGQPGSSIIAVMHRLNLFQFDNSSTIC